MEMGICLDIGAMCPKLCTCERQVEREALRQEVSQALRYYAELGHSPQDSILIKKTKGDPPQLAGNKIFWWQLPGVVRLALRRVHLSHFQGI